MAEDWYNDDFVDDIDQGAAQADFYSSEDEDDSDGACIPSGKNCFPPPLSHWKDVEFSQHPKISIDMARTQLWKQGQLEIGFFRNKFAQGGIDQVFDLLFGERSELCHAFKKLDMRNEDYYQFLATFFFSTRFSMNYEHLYNDPRMTASDFMSPKDFNGVLCKIEQHGSNTTFGKRFWELLENAFNECMKTNFFFDMVSWTDVNEGNFNWFLTGDDDKVLFAFGSKRNAPISKDSKLKRARHVRDNRTGFTQHVLAQCACDLPIQSRFERIDDNGYHAMAGMMKKLFDFDHENQMPNLAGKLVLAFDRQYLEKPLLSFSLNLGADILGSLKRSGWNPFTFGKENKSHLSSKKGGPQNIAIQGAKCVFQKTYKHNLGKKGEKHRKLTATGY